MDSDDHTSQQMSHTMQSPSTTCSRPETPGADINMLSIKNALTIPNSPPPSYEYVLEEKRLVKDAKEEEIEEQDQEENYDTCPTNRSDVNLERQNHSSLARGANSTERTPVRGPEIVHKSSKEFYRAVAKQWGITCKMSDQCRCLDCQSCYFDCDYDNNDQEKTDGGLGAGAPMFINEVMHGAACVLL